MLTSESILLNSYRANSLRCCIRFVDRDMFMRFQFGMSVGHTYMHAPSFPAAAVPAIPPDFDHCLDGVLALGERGAGVIPTELTLSGGALQCDEGTHEAGFGDSEVRTLETRNEADAYEAGPDRYRGGGTARRTSMKTGMKMMMEAWQQSMTPTRGG